MLILVTGPTGKVGQQFIADLLDAPRFSEARIRALCHNRLLEETGRLAVMRGSIADRGTVAAAMDGVTHVVHLATCKETPEDVMDVTVRGLFWLLEAFRTSPTARQFILIGGDAAVGHFFYAHDGPITEATPHRAYPGCYALSKVLEEVIVEQYAIQYGMNVCCLRAPWIMEKDDFKHSLSFGDDVFGSRNRRSQSLGSGVIISNDGYVITNSHVVGTNARAREVTVSLWDNREVPGTVIGIASGLLNPKNALFYLSLAAALAGAPPLTLIAYGAWMFTIVLVWDVFVAIALGSRHALTRLGRIVPWLTKAAGGFLVLLGLAMIATISLQLLT